MGTALADALAHMSAHGLTHGDIKPSNIGFTRDGRAKLLDFGLSARALSADEPADWFARRSVRAGTPAYLPPEAHRGNARPGDCDTWGLALSLLEAALGGGPVVAPRLAHDVHAVAGAVRLACRRLAQTAPELSVVLARALDTRPRRRFTRAIDLLAALRGLDSARRRR